MFTKMPLLLEPGSVWVNFDCGGVLENMHFRPALAGFVYIRFVVTVKS